MSDADRTICVCPACESARFGIIDRSQESPPKPPQAKCSDCAHVYDIATLPAPPEPKQKRKRGSRNGSTEATLYQPPDPKDAGTGTWLTEDIIGGGESKMRQAMHQAAKIAKATGEAIEAHWMLKTPWLQEIERTGVPAEAWARPATATETPQLATSSRASATYPSLATPDRGQSSQSLTRARTFVRRAMQWRPRFLAVLSLTRASTFACRAAGIDWRTAQRHREHDPDFARQCEEAEAHAVTLLHDVTMKTAIEGELEPVFWQGIRVGSVRKMDNRLRIEMLRAHMPQTFKTPGKDPTSITVNTGPVLQVTPDVAARLQHKRREAHAAILEAEAQQLPSPLP